MKWQGFLDRFPFKLIRGEGFSVKFFHPSGFVRYIEKDREITLYSTKADETEQRGRRWLFLPTLATILYIPSVPRWDDGTSLDQGQFSVVLDRLCATFDHRGWKYRVVVDDDQYAKMQETVDGMPEQFPGGLRSSFKTEPPSQ
jgi:hypothetical protein